MFGIGVASEPGRGGQPSGQGRGTTLSGSGSGGQRNTDDYVAFEVGTVTDEGAGEVIVPVAVVAAGVHTQGRDDRPSQVVVEAIYTVLRSEQSLPIAPRLVKALHAANQVLYQQAAVDPTLAGVGASVVAATIIHNTLYLAYVGDCRAYLLRNGYAHPLTLPTQRVPPPEPVRAGLPTYQATVPDATASMLGSAAVSMLGSAAAVEVATAIAPLDQRPQGLDAIPPTVLATSLRLAPTDTLVLCSPGLYKGVTDQEIARIASSAPAQDAAWQLADLANAAEAADSYTILVIQQMRAAPPAVAPVRKVAPARPVRKVRRALLAAACLCVLFLTWPTLVQQGSRLANQISTNFAQSIFPAFAQGQEAGTDIAAGVITKAAQPVAPNPVTTAMIQSDTSQINRQPPLAMPTGVSQPVAQVVPAPVVAQANQPAALVTGQRLAMFIGTTTQNSLATLSNTIARVGALVAAGRVATAEALAALPPTPTMTPTPLATVRAPARQRPAATATKPAPVATTPDFSQAAVTLIEPLDFDTLTSAKRAFRWQANFTLPAGYAFEVVFWQLGQDPMRQGRGYAGLSAQPRINVGYEHFRIRTAPVGEYRWGVLLVTKEPYQRIKYLGGGAVLYVKQQ